MNEPTLLDTRSPPPEGAAATMVANATGTAATEGSASGAPGRATILPRVTLDRGAPSLVPDLRERFEPTQRLGAGGVGEVILARDNDIERPVAIKKLLPGADDADGLARFIDEIRTLGELDHPNIVPVHDVGVDADGRYYYVMKYVEGETLEHVIERLAAGDRDYHRRYPFTRRVEVFRQILHGVQFAHDRGIIHRDIKPANVMIGRYGEVLVMDWGIARRIRANGGVAERFPINDKAKTLSRAPSKVPPQLRTQTGSILGTPAYMSPEQARGEIDALDERTDIYALCVMFHEFMSLRHYLAGCESITACLAGVLRDPIPFAHFIRNPHQAAVPPDLSHFIRHGVEKERDARYRTVAEMLARLDRIEDGRCPVECPSTFTKRVVSETARAVDHHPIWVMAAGVGVVALMATGLAAVLVQAL
ncbi:MAG: serine/threonine-protein kinase [Polyangiales bacterium]